MKNRFLAIMWDNQNADSKDAKFMTEEQIINFVSMKDCHTQEIRVFDIQPENPTELKIHGTWHDSTTPLLIKLTDPNGEVVISGYGDDH